MRISNNALRFLLAQYRAIFKQAYIKGLATAVLLTAGLAVGQAQAANLTTNNLPNAGQIAHITGDSGASGNYDENGSGEFNRIDINTSGTHTLNGSIIFNSGTGGNNYILGQGNEELKLTGNGAIEVNITSTDPDATSEQGIFIHGHGQATTVDIKELKVTRGELDISDKNSDKSGDVIVAADTITIGSASGGDTTQAFLNLFSKGDAKTATLGRADDTSGRSDSKITVYNDGLLTVATSTGSGTQILGDELSILAGGVMLTNDGNANTVASKNLTVAAESFKVISGNGTSETFTGQTGLIQGNLLIDEGASWILDAADGAALNMTFASGANIQLGGSVSVDAGNLIVEEGAGLYATSTTDSSIKLNQDGSLAIASTDLYKFLKGQDQSGDNINYQPIQGSDDEYSLVDTPAQANQGAILLSGGGTLKFTDAEQIDLAHDFSFSGSNTTKAGYISVSGGGTIIANDILIAKKLGDANDPMYPSGLQIDVNELTLGDDQETITGQLGFSSATTHNLTVLHTADNDENAFNLHNHLYLRATNRDVTMDGDIVEVAEDGTIDGNLNIIGQANLTVEAGHYTTKDNLTVSNGKLIVSGSNSNDTVLESSLTIQGDFKLNKTGSGNNDLAQVEITGATGASATLDLSQANSITWGSGSVIISGAESGAGTLKISGSQLEQYQDTTKTQSTITLADQGILSVVGSTTSLDLNVKDFSKVSAESGAIFFSGAGTVEFDTEQTISSSGDALSIGAGTIKAPALTLENTKEDATEFVVSGGIIQVESSLSSNQSKVSFIANNQSGGILLLDRADTATGTVKVDTSFSGNNSALKVTQGNWEFSEGHDASFSGGADFNIGTADTIASLKIDNINFTETNTEATSTIQAGSSLTANTMQAASGATFTIAGSLTIKGLDNIDSDSKTDPAASYSDTAGINLSGATFNVSGADAKLTIGQTATNALIKLPQTSNDTLTVAEALSGSTINLTDFATLNLEFDQDVKLSTADANALKSQLFANGDVGDGIINVGKAELSINWEQDQDLVAKWDEVKDFGAIESLTSNDLRQTLVIEISDSVAGHYGAMQVKPNETLSVDGVLGLHAARDGYFVFSETNNQKTEENVQIQDGTLLLAGAGKIGAIEGTKEQDGTLTSDLYITKYDSDLERAQDGTTEILGNVSNIANFKVSNATTVSGNVTAQALDLAANTSLSNLVEGAEHQKMSLGSAQLGIGSQLSTTDLTIGNNSASVDDSWIMGAVNVADTLTIEAKSNNAGDNNIVIAGGNVSAKSTVLADGVNLYVGLDKDVFADDSETDINEAASYTGSFETTSLKLNGGTLIVDPDYGETTALASVCNFADITSDTEFTDESKVGTLDGSIFVGSNSALGIGTESIEDLASVIAPYQTNGSLSENLGAIVYLNGIATIAEDQGLVMTNKSLTEFISYYNDNNGNQNDISDTSAPTIANTIFFGEGTALMVTANAVQKTDQNNALVTFESGDGTLVANGGEILISGDLRANTQTQYNLFADNGTDGSSKVSVKDIAGNEVGEGSGITIKTENGFLVGEVNNDNGGQNITLDIAENGRSLMSGASDPVYDTLVSYVRGYNGDPSDVLYNGYIDTDSDGDGQLDKNLNYSNYFLAGAISQNGGAAAAETAARFSIYGGAPQAAMQAGKSSSDAIAARFGIGSAFSNLTIAANAQGATLWLAPVYKSSDSDGFAAQGVDYGVDVDLYGVALGADYTLANGITFGAMFNVGSGEVDGEGAASSTSNDFDYYGFGAYLGYQYQAFSVMADISYTTADNEIEAHTSVDKIGAQLDSTNLSVGVTGKYDLVVNDVKVTPHVGVRFSNIDLDDYTIDGREVVGSATSDDMNIFSIPVGVTIAKEFKSETWTVAPSFDLTLTGQFGDDELDGAISWAGVSNLTTSTTTEVFDNFTYGATLGVEAENVNGVAFGIGVNYTGSSNVDEFGVNANARFTF